MKIVLATLILVIYSGFAISSDDLESISLQLKWRHQFQFAGYYAAQIQGYYKEQGFDVSILARDINKSPMQQVINKEVDYAVSDSSVVRAVLQKHPIVVVSTVFQRSPLILIVRADSNISSPYELMGKRIMYQDGIDDATIQAMFNVLGIGKEQIISVKHNFDDYALVNHQVDAMSAYFSTQPFVYEQLGIDIVEINPASYGIDFYGDLLITHTDRINSSPERVLAFKQATIQGWEYALQHPEEIIDHIHNELNASSSLDQLRFEATQTRRAILPELVPIGTVKPERFQQIADIYQLLGFAEPGSTLGPLLIEDYIEQQTSLSIYGRVSLIILPILVFVVLSLVYINRRLATLVKHRMQKLNEYVDVIDAHVMSCRLDSSCSIRTVSDRFAQVLGYQSHELINRSIFELLSKDSVACEFIESLHDLVSWHGEVSFSTKSDEQIWVKLKLFPLHAENELDELSIIAEDITDKKHIEYLSITDTLTGLFNRLKIDKELQSEWQRFQRTGHDFSIILVDLDDFKLINDRHGHLMGDSVLQLAARTLQLRLRQTDVIGRWGGEEFLVVCPSTDITGARMLAEQLRSDIEKLPSIEGSSTQFTASFGVASSSIGIKSIRALIANADEALYRAKAIGKNSVCYSNA